MSLVSLSGQDKQLIVKGIKRIVTLADECVISADNPSRENRPGRPVATYRRTDTGLYLEFNYGKPNALRTPWGRWQFMDWHPVMDTERFRSSLTLEEYLPVRRARQGDAGPIYTVLAVEDMAMPLPAEMLFCSTDDTMIRTEWQELTGVWVGAL